MSRLKRLKNFCIILIGLLNFPSYSTSQIIEFHIEAEDGQIIPVFDNINLHGCSSRQCEEDAVNRVQNAFKIFNEFAENISNEAEYQNRVDTNYLKKTSRKLAFIPNYSFFELFYNSLKGQTQDRQTFLRTYYKLWGKNPQKYPHFGKFFKEFLIPFILGDSEEGFPTGPMLFNGIEEEEDLFRIKLITINTDDIVFDELLPNGTLKQFNNGSSKVLKKINHNLWELEKIKSLTQGYYLYLGYDISIEFPQPTSIYTPPYRITIIPKRITRIILNNIIDTPTVNKVLYTLLSTEEWIWISRMDKQLLAIGSQWVYEPYLSFMNPKLKREFIELANYEKLKINAYELNSLNCLILTEKTTSGKTQSITSINSFASLNSITPIKYKDSYLDLICTSTNSISSSSNTKIVNSASPIENEASSTPNELISKPRNNFKEDTLPTKKQSIRFRRNLIAAELAYHSQVQLTTSVFYQHTLTNQTYLSFKTGFTVDFENKYKNHQPFMGLGINIKGSFYKDYIFFNKSKKRMSLLVKGGTQSTLKRTNLNISEQKNGGQIKYELEWFKRAKGNLLRTSLRLDSYYVTWDSIKSSTEIKRVDTFSNTSLSLGLMHYLYKKHRNIKVSLLSKPELEIGYGNYFVGKTGDWFLILKKSTNLNINTFSGFIFDMSINAQYTTAKTPRYLHSNIKQSENRGFRQDILLTQSYFNAQFELMIPLPKFKQDWSKRIWKTLYQHIRLAVFCDYSIYFPENNVDKQFTFISPGVGIRVLVAPVQINFDFSYGYLPREIKNIGAPYQFSLNVKFNHPF